VLASRALRHIVLCHKRLRSVPLAEHIRTSREIRHCIRRLRRRQHIVSNSTARPLAVLSQRRILYPHTSSMHASSRNLRRRWGRRRDNHPYNRVMLNRPALTNNGFLRLRVPILHLQSANSHLTLTIYKLHLQEPHNLLSGCQVIIISTTILFLPTVVGRRSRKATGIAA
jgi:hypothetical protein